MAIIIPIKIDAVTFLYASTAITTSPINATIPPIIAFICSGVTPSSLHAAKLSIATKVESFPTTRPAFFNPIMVIKSPMPGVIALLMHCGIARIIASRKPTAVININKSPEIKTITNAC